ncbi:TATA-binding protein-associated factor, partial [Armadillidium nasatum]
MSSRLDRLFVLLENGGSDATRQAAALQLGEIVKLHPHELSNLLSKLKTFLSSKSWETRIAAGEAVSAILSNVPPWDPQPQEEEHIKSDNEAKLKNNGQLSLQTFSIKRVLEKGSYLYAADEQNFDLEENMEYAPNSKEAVDHQRNLINQKLGLDIAESLGINTQNIFSASDLTTEVTQKGDTKSTVGEVFQEELDSVGLQMSSRERNKAKRKAKHISQKKKSLSESTDISCDEASDRKRLKISEADKSDDGDGVSVNETLNSQEETWPLEQFAEHVSQDLFNCSWEVRHGAGTALRELIRLHGLGAGKKSFQTSQQMSLSHMTWLEDKAFRIICVLALDRFGDFLADQVVAPVRETCAQVLGCIVKYLSESSIFSIWNQLKEMINWSDWETRHGGFL